MADAKAYTFMTDTLSYAAVETKAGKEYYVTGYISDGSIDLVKDLVTTDCMKSMLEQIRSRSITLDYDHEAFRDNPSILPAGKIVDARIDEKGLWVKAKLNSASPKFKNLWSSIKEGFVTAFSIAYRPVKTAFKTIGDTTVRLLDDVVLLNVALTGVPVNQGAVIDGYGMKAVMLKALSDLKETEVDPMDEKEIQKLKADLKSELSAEIKSAVESSFKEMMKATTEEKSKQEEAVKAAAKAAAEQKSSDNAAAEKQALEKFEADLKSLKEEHQKTVEALKKVEESPMLKSMAPAGAPAQGSENSGSILGLIR